MADNDGALDAVVIERTFDAPIATVWEMWTKPEHFAGWYGPTGASIPVVELDVTVGGTRRVRMEMTTPKGSMQMWFVGQFQEIVENQRLVYTESMADADGNVLSPSDMGMPAGHPTTTEIEVELHDLGGRTRMVMTHHGIPAGSAGAAGWNMAFDKLAAYVADAILRNP